MENLVSFHSSVTFLCYGIAVGWTFSALDPKKYDLDEEKIALAVRIFLSVCWPILLILAGYYLLVERSDKK